MQVLTGVCPDPECKKQLFFPAELSASIECTNCGQRHSKQHLVEVEPVSNPGHALQGLLQSIVSGQIPDHVKKTSDFIKVRGLSNYGCKLISPLLTKYGLHKDSQEVRLLRDMNQGETFDCSHLADRAFLIEEQNLQIPGYGRDTAANYLQDTLEEIAKVNDGEERLLPIHADGDGHCLLHAISRALVGHELFWHPLLTNLKLHFTQRQEDYQNLFRDFIEVSEWKDIIAECDPNFVPSYGEAHGLRNIHILGLANILNRPIILIDSLEGMRSKGDYSGVFLPGLVSLDKCKNRKGILHKPVVIAWSSKGRNHFIPLVGIQGNKLPLFPVTLLPKVWGLPQDLLAQYIEFENNCCVIGGGNSLQEKYLRKLTQAMEEHFLRLTGVSSTVVIDVYHHIFRSNGVVGVTTKLVTDTAIAMAKDERLYKCLYCHAVIEEKLPCLLTSLEPGGELYELAKKTHTFLKDGYKYKFPIHDIVCEYDKAKDKLKYVHSPESLQCPHCKGSLRLLKANGGLIYHNGDQLSKPSSNSSKCGSGYKHYWDGNEFDNLPIKIPVALEWNDEKFEDFVYWFQNESDPSLNSNAYQVAQEVVQAYFPGEFGSERLVQKVVDKIFHYTTKLKKKSEPSTQFGEKPSCIPTKIILTGEKSKSLHKEELNANNTEKSVQKKIENMAAVKQKRLSSPLTKQTENGTLNQEKELSISPSREKIKKSNTTKKVRIACEDRGNVVFTLHETTSYLDLANFIQEQFQIVDEEFDIEYGFPPKVLLPNLDAEGSHKPLTVLKHGEKLTVHVRKVQKQPEIYHETEEEESMHRAGIDHLANSLFALFDNVDAVDLWPWAESQRTLFEVNGMIYKMAFKDLGILSDDDHFSLPCFPGKIFSYSHKDDEILLCLGSKHIPVRPLTEQEVKLASEQALKKQQEHIKPRSRDILAAASNPNRVVAATGHTLNDGNNESSRVVEDGIVTIKETIDFATFAMETDAFAPSQEDTDKPPNCNGGGIGTNPP